MAARRAVAVELAEAEAPLHNFGGMLGSGELDPVSSRSAPAERAGRLRRNSVVAKAPAVGQEPATLRDLDGSAHRGPAQVHGGAIRSERGGQGGEGWAPVQAGPGGQQMKGMNASPERAEATVKRLRTA